MIGTSFMKELNLNFYTVYIILSVSTVTKGKQMIPALNKIGVRAAVYGNHDFGKILATLTPMMELFLKNNERLKVLFIFAKVSTIDTWYGPKHTFAILQKF